MPEIKVIRDDIFSSAGGLAASTAYDIGNRQQLTLRTGKNDRTKRLETVATVATVDDRGFSTFAFGFGTSGGDFYERLESSPCPRATKRAIENQHQMWVVKVQTVMDLVRAHYAKAQVIA
jgi:hypothetical protein